MKVRTWRGALAGTRLSARLTILGCGTMTILASAAVSACSGSPGVSAPSFSPGGTLSPRPSGSDGDTASTSPIPGTGTSASTSPSPETSSPTPTPTATPEKKADKDKTPSPIPTAAPATGGGGTAGLQDPLLLALGGMAVLAGAGSLAYRRRIIRNR
jgi:hypothetical protein